jgi:hypothetical protein
MSIPAPTFLTLPLEIRLQIYANLYPSLCLLPPPSLLSGIGSVCRQTRQEIFPIVLQVPRYFWTVERLWDWTLRGEQRNLELVSEISITFSDESFSKSWTLEQVRKAIDDDPVPHGGQWWELAYLMGLQPEIFKPASVRRPLIKAFMTHVNSINKKNNKEPKSAVVSTWEAFTSLPNLRRLSINFENPLRYAIESNPISYPHLLNSLHKQQLILEMISRICPMIQSLIISRSSGLLDLSYLTEYHNLKHLNFNGRFKNSPESALQIFKGLEHLDSLTLMHLPQTPIISSTKSSSITPDIIAKMNPLRALSLLHLTIATPTEVFTESLLQALTCHNDSLRTLLIHVVHCVEGDLFQGLLNFISKSRITDLTILLRIPKQFGSLDVQSYFPDAIQIRHVEFVEAKPTGRQNFSQMSEVLVLDMRGHSCGSKY